MRWWLLALVQVAGVLSGPDPAQMEQAADFGYRAVPHGLVVPASLKFGAPSSAAFDGRGHLLVFTRSEPPLMEFDAATGAFVRGFGQDRYVRPHGMRIDPSGHIWTTDVNGHTVTKMQPDGEVLLTLGVRGTAGNWDEAGGSRLLNEPNDIGFAANGDVFVVQGHGRGEPRVLRFDKAGRFLRSWGGKGTRPGEFDIAHSVVVDAKGLVYVADRQNRRVQIFDMDGRYLKEWRFKGLPCGLYLGRDQQMYLVSGFAGQVLKLDGDGRAVSMMGQPGRGLGEFGEAHFMTMAQNGEIFVADTVKPDLHRFAPERPAGR
jgi:sugar lactone lactonase YvrE